MVPLTQGRLYKYIKLSAIYLWKIFIPLDQNCSIRYMLEKSKHNIISENGESLLKLNLHFIIQVSCSCQCMGKF